MVIESEKKIPVRLFFGESGSILNKDKEFKKNLTRSELFWNWWTEEIDYFLSLQYYNRKNQK